MVIEASVAYIFPDKSLFLIKINNGFLRAMRSSINKSFFFLKKRVREDNSLINRTWRPSKVHYVSWSMWGGEIQGGWHVKNISHDESCKKMPVTLQRATSGVWSLPLSRLHLLFTCNVLYVILFQMQQHLKRIPLDAKLKGQINLFVLPDWKGGEQTSWERVRAAEGLWWAISAVTGWGMLGWAQKQEGDAVAKRLKAKGVRSTSTLLRYQLMTSNENIFPLDHFPDFQRQERCALCQQHRYYR